MNLSFAGCGFMGIYHVGVAACLRKYAIIYLFPLQFEIVPFLFKGIVVTNDHPLN